MWQMHCSQPSTFSSLISMQELTFFAAFLLWVFFQVTSGQCFGARPKRWANWFLRCVSDKTAARRKSGRHVNRATQYFFAALLCHQSHRKLRFQGAAFAARQASTSTLHFLGSIENCCIHTPPCTAIQNKVFFNQQSLPVPWAATRSTWPWVWSGQTPLGNRVFG